MGGGAQSAIILLVAAFPALAAGAAPQAPSGSRQDELRSLTEAHKARPGDWKTCNQLGLLYIQLQQLENALEFFQKTVDLNPDFIPARKNRATVLWFLGRKRESEQQFRSLAKELPADSVPHLYLGLAAYEGGTYSEAAGHFEKAGDLAFANPEVLPAVVRTYIGLGEAEDRRGAPEAAYRAFQKAIQADPRSDDAYTALARFAAAHQNRDFALKVLEEGIGKVPGSGQLRLEQGILYAIGGKTEEAERSFLEAGRIETKSIAPVLARGVLRLEQGNHAAAAELFRKAAEMAPTDYRPEYLYASAIARTGTGAGAEVIRALEKSVALQPGIAASHAALGKAYADASRTDEAVRALEKALSIEPNNATALYQLGRLYRKLGKMDDSRSLTERLKKVKQSQTAEEWKMVQVLKVRPDSVSPGNR
jgi:tetratricopeptide (TPR) repeat protein